MSSLTVIIGSFCVVVALGLMTGLALLPFLDRYEARQTKRRLDE